MAEQFANLARTTLSAGIDDTVTSMDVVDGSIFPATGTFSVRIDTSTGINIELVTVTARSSNTLTVTRGEDATYPAVSHASGERVTMVQTRGAMEALAQLDNANVFTATPQTLRDSGDTADLVILDRVIVDPSFDGTADTTSEHGQLFLGTSRNTTGWRVRTSRTYWQTGESLQFVYVDQGTETSSIVFDDQGYSTSSQSLTLHAASYVALCLDTASNGSAEIFHTWNNTNSLGMAVSFNGPTRAGTSSFPSVTIQDYTTSIPIVQDRTRLHVAGYGKGVGVGVSDPFGLFDICGSTIGGSTFLSARSSTSTHREQVEFAPSWVVSTDASRTSRLVVNVYDTAAREAFRIEASGSAPKIGFLGAAAVLRQTITGVRTGTLGELQTVVQNLLTALANLGLITDSTT